MGPCGLGRTLLYYLRTYLLSGKLAVIWQVLRSQSIQRLVNEKCFNRSALLAVMMLALLRTVQCTSGDDNENDVDDDMEMFNDCDEQVPVVRPIPQSYMIRPPADTRAFPADTAASRAHPPAYADGKYEPERAAFWFHCRIVGLFRLPPPRKFFPRL